MAPQGTPVDASFSYKAVARVSLGDLSQTYDGHASFATATTSPPDLDVTFLYSQNGQMVTSPTAAGVYDVVATIVDANFQGTATGELTIAQVPLTITAQSEMKSFGNPDPVLAYQVTSGAFFAGDGPSGALARFPGEAVGSYAINQGTLSAGPNYVLIFVPANLTIIAAATAISLTGSTGDFGFLVSTSLFRRRSR